MTPRNVPPTGYDGFLYQSVLPLLGLRSSGRWTRYRRGNHTVCDKLYLSALERSTRWPLQGDLKSCYSWAKASRSWLSCSSGRLVEIISKSYCLSSSAILSNAVAPLVSANRAEVPSVPFSRTFLIKSSSIPTSFIAPHIPPIAAPSQGTKKISPIRKPQKAPQPAPPPCNSRVFGFLLPWGQLTTAASWSVINSRSCMPCRAMSTLPAPYGSSNFSTDSVANSCLLSLGALCDVHPA